MINKKIRIDPHVHCRDGEQAYKETVAGTLREALNQGIEIVFDMPNTNPPILNREDVGQRLKLVPGNRKGNYCLYVGLTANKQQIKEALKCYEEFDEVIGFKLFAGKSVGSLAVIKEEEQRIIYKTLADSGYMGVIAVHCEKEKYINSSIWDPTNPISHSLARPKKAEIESIKDQIKFAIAANFKGTLHVLHITCAEAVELVEKARKKIKVTCGVTPHHLMWNNEKLKESIFYKMNPPLRSRGEVKKLREKLQEGKIDWIETDYAPHTMEEKMSPPYMSGVPSLYLYRYLVKIILPILNISKGEIEKLIFYNIYKTFKNKLKKILARQPI